jgi:hypothetical protein
MQILLLNLAPIAAESRYPVGGKVRILLDDMFNGQVIQSNVRLVVLVFKPIKNVAAAAHVVDVPRQERVEETLVVQELLVGIVVDFPVGTDRQPPFEWLS